MKFYTSNNDNKSTRKNYKTSWLPPLFHTHNGKIIVNIDKINIIKWMEKIQTSKHAISPKPPTDNIGSSILTSQT